MAQYRSKTKDANLKLSNVDHRPNKVAKGFTKQYERGETQGKIIISNPKHPNFNRRGTFHEILSLTVRGTTDELKGLGWMYRKLIKKEHPTEKGYFKEVFVLTDSGRYRLKKLKELLT